MNSTDNDTDLDLLDSAIAGIEGLSPEESATEGKATRRKRAQYRPTRDPDEALRLMDKYIARVVRTRDAWAAVGPSGRCCVGPTLPIAVCMAIVEAR